MPRVLYISHNHPEIAVGGTEVFSYELFRGVREHGEFDPIYVAGTTSPGFRDGGPFHALGPRRDEILWSCSEHDYFNLTSHDKRRFTVDFRGLLSALRPDLVHFHHTMGLGLDLIRVVRLALPRAPIVYTLHEFVPICAANGLMVRRDGQLCSKADPSRCHDCIPERSPNEHLRRERQVKAHFRHVDQFLAPSHFLRKRYIGWGMAEERIRYQPQGRRPRPARCPLDPAVSRLGFFGQLRPHKGVLLLLRAVDRLAREGVEVHLSVHGAHLDDEEASFRSEIKRRLRRARSVVTYLGPYSPDRVEVLMGAVAWVVVPSLWWENSPLVIEEAFQAGRPVICSDVGGMAEKVSDGVNGIHFRMGDENALVAALRRAVGSETLWRELSLGIPSVPPIEETVEEHLSLYRSLLTRRLAASGPAEIPS